MKTKLYTFIFTGFSFFAYSLSERLNSEPLLPSFMSEEGLDIGFEWKSSPRMLASQRDIVQKEEIVLSQPAPIRGISNSVGAAPVKAPQFTTILSEGNYSLYRAILGNADMMIINKENTLDVELMIAQEEIENAQTGGTEIHANLTLSGLLSDGKDIGHSLDIANILIGQDYVGTADDNTFQVFQMNNNDISVSFYSGPLAGLRLYFTEDTENRIEELERIKKGNLNVVHPNAF